MDANASLPTRPAAPSPNAQDFNQTLNEYRKEAILVFGNWTVLGVRFSIW